jgi:hypothetical protein
MLLPFCHRLQQCLSNEHENRREWKVASNESHEMHVLLTSAPDKRQDNTVFPRARALVNHLHKYNRTISSKNLLVIKQQAILAIGMDGHRCTRSKGKPHSRNSTARIQKWTFLGEFGNKNDPSFCNVHNHWY